MRKFSQVLFIAFLPIFLFAQNTVSGTVTDASTGEALAGANVVVTGTSMGAAATADGSYSISNVPAGSYTITASVIGSFRILESLTDVPRYKYKMCNMRSDLSENFRSFATLYFIPVLLGGHMRLSMLTGV